MLIYLIDNFDSFTYNLVHYFESFDCEVIVARNNTVNYQEIEKADAIVLSPGPGLPKNAGEMMDVIDKFHLKKPILGVCLGHQAIAEYFGLELYNLDQVYHGKKKELTFNNEATLFKSITTPLEVGLYHSWAVKINSQDFLLETAHYEGINMSFQHATLPIFGVQFHPESILSNQGKNIIYNFLQVLKNR